MGQDWFVEWVGFLIPVFMAVIVGWSLRRMGVPAWPVYVLLTLVVLPIGVVAAVVGIVRHRSSANAEALVGSGTEPNRIGFRGGLMMTEPTVSVRLRPLAGFGAVFVLMTGAVMLSRQDLYIAAGPRSFDRSINWWGLGIGWGLVAGGIIGVGAVVAKIRPLLIGSALLAMASAMWHPLLWPALVAAIPMLVFGVSIDGRAPATPLTEPGK